MSGPTARARFDGSVHGVVVQTSTPLAGLELEPDREGRVLALAVGVVEAGLEVRQRRLALPAVGEHPHALVEQALVVERLEGPHDRLHVRQVHRLVVVDHVDPAGLAGRRTPSQASAVVPTIERQYSLNRSTPYSRIATRPDTPRACSASISTGRPWQSQPKRRSTRWPRIVR